MLRFLRNESNLPWLCAGDFNEVLHDHEQMGGNDHEEWKMEGFREPVGYCGFTDLAFLDLSYTWDNKREGNNNVKVRLDRALADNGMLDLFGDSFVLHVQTTVSDHCALLIQLNRSGEIGGRGRGKPFQYGNMWQRHESYEETVVTAWMRGFNFLDNIHSSLGEM